MEETIKKLKIERIKAIIVSAIFGTILWILAERTDFKNWGGLSTTDIILDLTLIFFLIGFIYILIYEIKIRRIKDEIYDSNVLKVVKEMLGEDYKKVLYERRDNSTESYILTNVVKAFKPIYYAKMCSDDTVDLYVKNENNEVLCIININNLNYFRSHFEIDEDEDEDQEKDEEDKNCEK